MPFNVDLGPNRGGSWLGRPKGGSPSIDLIGSYQFGVENGGGRRISGREKEEERKKREGKKIGHWSFVFFKPVFILFSIF